MLAFTYYQAPMYHFQPAIFSTIMDALALWFSLSSLFHSLFDKSEVDDMGSFFMIFGLAFVVYAITYLHSLKI